VNRTIRTMDDVVDLMERLPTSGLDHVERPVTSDADRMDLLDRRFTAAADRWTADASTWWDDFYADRSKPIPFFATKPDENLVSYVERGLLTPSRPAPAGGAAAPARAQTPARALDLVYDSGCLHHLPPHRRVSYLALLDRVLASGGHFAVACFAAGAMGSELPDEDFYRDGRLHGGLAYTPESLRWIFSDLTAIEIRMMEEQPPDAPCFGVPFLVASLFRRPTAG
ncbi:hypothetical protein JYK22_41250, partial [Nonomuraea sp. RK-328]|nr:hypothetical protein [Nonomuraea sp. RK-328]